MRGAKTATRARMSDRTMETVQRVSCGLCHKSFRHVTGLNIHIGKAHGNAKPRRAPPKTKSPPPAPEPKSDDVVEDDSDDVEDTNDSDSDSPSVCDSEPATEPADDPPRSETAATPPPVSEDATGLSRIETRLVNLEKMLSYVYARMMTNTDESASKRRKTSQNPRREFGRESRIAVSKKDFLEKCARRRTKGICELVEATYFNPNHPENHTIYVPNVCLPYVATWTGKAWALTERDAALDVIVDAAFGTIADFVDDHGRSMSEKYSVSWMDRIQSWIEDVRSDDVKLRHEIRQELFMCIVNAQRAVVDPPTFGPDGLH
jgi:hypothetical protein